MIVARPIQPGSFKLATWREDLQRIKEGLIDARTGEAYFPPIDLVPITSPITGEPLVISYVMNNLDWSLLLALVFIFYNKFDDPDPEKPKPLIVDFQQFSYEELQLFMQCICDPEEYNPRQMLFDWALTIGRRYPEVSKYYNSREMTELLEEWEKIENVLSSS